jgi:hypothetical protein
MSSTRCVEYACVFRSVQVYLCSDPLTDIALCPAAAALPLTLPPAVVLLLPTRLL